MRESRLVWLASASAFALSMAALRCSSTTVDPRGGNSGSGGSDGAGGTASDAGAKEAGVCGNGKIDMASEQCDKMDLGGETCAKATANAKPNGTLACTSGCMLDVSACTGDGSGGSGGGAGMMGAGGSAGAGGTGGKGDSGGAGP